MTAILGHTVSLPCRVINLRDRTVSWIRSRDLTVLAVEKTTVTTDARISVVHPEDTEDWLLEIRGVAQSDEGTFECQVNTHPKISTKIHLKVIPERGHVSILDIPVSDTGIITDTKGTFSADEGMALRVRVIGRSWVQMPEGATLHLICEASGKELQDIRHYSIVRNEPLISWTLNGMPVNALWSRPKVDVRESWGIATVESEIEVRMLDKSDAGSYACNVPHVPADHVTVSVIENDYSDGHFKVASLGADDSAETLLDVQEEEDSNFVAVSAGKAAVISGAIILVLLLIQAGLCIFYIRKV
ncbi:uncharacterized protein LOC135210818 [Macrobrachium nipponense]|uniref:uncharacterized protein LOC135210818 n=1 Tax=Macrobrachium nipponense TaxID=159736 RepID=UPI0030C84AB9